MPPVNHIWFVCTTSKGLPKKEMLFLVSQDISLIRLGQGSSGSRDTSGRIHDTWDASPLQDMGKCKQQQQQKLLWKNNFVQ